MATVIFFANRTFGNLSTRCHRGPKILNRHHLATHIKLPSLNLKYETLEIREVSGPFEGKVLMYLLWAPLKTRYFTHLICRGWQQESVTLAFPYLNTPLCITLTMILYENMKPNTRF